MCLFKHDRSNNAHTCLASGVQEGEVAVLKNSVEYSVMNEE